MLAEAIVSWAAGRGLEGLPEPTGEAVLVPYGGETGVWTTRITWADGWLVLVAMTTLEVDAARVAEASRFAAKAGLFEVRAAVQVDPDTGDVRTVVSTLMGDGDASTVLDAAWSASVTATERWIPGLRDVASGIDADAAFLRVTGLRGGVL